MALYYEKFMVEEHSSFMSDKSAKWITLFIATRYSFKPKELLEKLERIVERACTVEKTNENAPLGDAAIYKFFYPIRPSFQGEPVAERLKAEIEAMEKRVAEMRALHAPQEWLEEAEDVDQDT